MFSLIKRLSENPQRPKPAGMWQLARAVFWSFFGVRKGKHLDQDAASATPGQIIIAGIIGAALFVAALLVLVRLITH